MGVDSFSFTQFFFPLFFPFRFVESFQLYATTQCIFVFESESHWFESCCSFFPKKEKKKCTSRTFERARKRVCSAATRWFVKPSSVGDKEGLWHTKSCVKTQFTGPH